MARATAAVLVKFTPEELAAVDLACAGVPRTVWVKMVCADAVRRQGVSVSGGLPGEGDARELVVVEGVRRGRAVGLDEVSPLPERACAGDGSGSPAVAQGASHRVRRVTRVLGAPRVVPVDPDAPAVIPGQIDMEEMLV